MNIDYVWRTIIGIGAIPGIAAIYFRMTIPETARFKIEVKGNIAGAIKDTNDLLNEIDSLDTKTTNQLLI
jgi:PHS family inorganic phosphate transporter-like MFS transporter